MGRPHRYIFDSSDYYTHSLVRLPRQEFPDLLTDMQILAGIPL